MWMSAAWQCLYRRKEGRKSFRSDLHFYFYGGAITLLCPCTVIRGCVWWERGEIRMARMGGLKQKKSPRRRPNTFHFSVFLLTASSRCWCPIRGWFIELSIQLWMKWGDRCKIIRFWGFTTYRHVFVFGSFYKHFLHIPNKDILIYLQKMAKGKNNHKDATFSDLQNKIRFMLKPTQYYSFNLGRVRTSVFGGITLIRRWF